MKGDIKMEYLPLLEDKDTFKAFFESVSLKQEKSGDASIFRSYSLVEIYNQIKKVCNLNINVYLDDMCDSIKYIKDIKEYRSRVLNNYILVLKEIIKIALLLDISPEEVFYNFKEEGM